MSNFSITEGTTLSGKPGFVVRFAAKPGKSVCSGLKAHGFRWSPGLGAWYSKSVNGKPLTWAQDRGFFTDRPNIVEDIPMAEAPSVPVPDTTDTPSPVSVAATSEDARNLRRILCIVATASGKGRKTVEIAEIMPHLIG
jgi:hypothetical protein